jgi:hypothetical protein
MYINDGKVIGADFWGLQKALNNGFKAQNIYITSDEEIKEGDFIYSLSSDEIIFVEKGEASSLNKIVCKKIILTTDQDLIKDGVQAIDDEFLEWFVENPSCEEVEIINTFDYIKKGYVSHSGYKITIPKEELKQETLEETLEETAEKYSEEYFNRDEIEMRCSKISFIDGYKLAQEQILDFLYEEITERRDYSASKMCEQIIEFIKNI